jgi:Ca2+-binding EF-hand superfamily protein
LQHAFKLYDQDKNGTMNAAEFKQVLVDLGKRDVTDQQVSGMLAEVDKNNDSVIQWNEFLEMFKQLKVSNKDLFSQVLTTKAG